MVDLKLQDQAHVWFREASLCIRDLGMSPMARQGTRTLQTHIHTYIHTYVYYSKLTRSKRFECSV
jgi:hypothetical protein